MNKNLLIGIGVAVVVVGGVAVYQMNNFVDRNTTQDERGGFVGNRPGGMERTGSEISFADLSVGQTVAVTGTTTDGSFIAQTITVMGEENNFGPGPTGERPEGFGGGGRPPMPQDGGPRGGPAGGGVFGLAGFEDRVIGNITAITGNTLTISSLEGTEETILTTEDTQFLSF